MRFAFVDLLLAIAISCCGDILLMPVAGVWWGAAFALLGYLIVSSPLYRLLHFYPLLLPKCPFCRDLNRHWRTVHREWPQEIIECGICQRRLELCCGPRLRTKTLSTSARYELQWPYSIGGRWRRT
jgi:hypothetical protein